MTPLYIEGRAGPLFILYHPPAAAAAPRGALIFVPPFAEELNRSRHMMAKAARTLAQDGWAVLILDLSGTGDSSGDFAEARWDIWTSDILAARTWLQDQGHDSVGLMGLRCGCLLATDVMKAADWSPVLFWQPVIQGKTFLTQFLRVALAANMSAPGEAQASVSSLREEMTAGKILEVAGYEIHPDLAQALDAARLTPDATWPLVHCLEVNSQAPALTPGLARAVENWRQAGAAVKAEAVASPQFWALQEPEWADALIDATLKGLRGGS